MHFRLIHLIAWFQIVFRRLFGKGRSAGPAVPGPLRISTFKERHEMSQDYILFDVTLPALSEPTDVVSRELKVFVDGDEADSRTAAAGDSVVTDLEAPQDAAVRLELRDTDDAGNQSAPSTIEFVAADTIPPTQPGEMSVTVVGERHDSETPTDESVSEEPADESSNEEPGDEEATDESPAEPTADVPADGGDGEKPNAEETA
ncbi:MAG: hypothetical protein DWQ31_16750 [Planctomycetota bacterium]|nr:MAG: hypothetical protein DWQ31_16750 [Planctomycetota bacterium]REJ92003.1 MAG: hypothetical protein DWQ35_12700 [Planctomycetota bacterium]REK28539.1 MAG: hypothetical protein DWQ42_04290 [Planctomycetota bacterium]REK39154.1 MAG: hypothetical protein DWQ46_17875 [Planctomycetota bacterium]